MKAALFGAVRVDGVFGSLAEAGLGVEVEPPLSAVGWYPVYLWALIHVHAHYVPARTVRSVTGTGIRIILSPTT